MNEDHVPKGFASRSKSVGAVHQESAAKQSIPNTHEIQNEIGNGGVYDGFDEEGISQDSLAGNQRPLMMYDESGNAIPVPMGKFYYDNVAPNVSDDQDLKGPDTENSCMTKTAAMRLPQDRVYLTHNEAVENNKTENKENYEKDRALVEDVDDDEYEDDPEDPFANQFMRIQAPAARLKDVSRVKRDLHHDKPRRRGSMMVGLQRAVSSVRISENARSNQGLARSQSRVRVSAAKLGRLMSKTKEKKQPGEGSNENLSHSPPNLQDREKPSDLQRQDSSQRFGGLQRARESTASKPGRRQGLAAVGRMMSLKKQKGSTREVATEQRSEGAGTSDSNDRPVDIPRAQTATSTNLKGGVRSSIAQVGRMLSMQRKKPVANPRNPEVSGSQGSDIPGKMLESESINSDISLQRDRLDSKGEKQNTGAVRVGLAKMGRMMSFRKKPQNSKAVENSIEGAKESNNAVHFSPLSSSTVSSKVAENSKSSNTYGGEHDRTRPTSSATSRKESGRMNLRAAGRLLSFSRKPAGTEANRESNADGKNSNMKRAQSAPPKRDEHDSSSKGRDKLDGRASTFYYSVINSESVLECKLLESNSHIRIPVIAMAEYSGPVSQTKWFVDAFTLPHNAVRRECIDLYDVLSGMARCHGSADITRDDLNDFEDWWRVASKFFKCYFEMERTILFPWVDKIARKEMEIEMALRKMRTMKDKLQELQGKVDKLWKDKELYGAGHMFCLLYKSVDDFVPRMMNYFADQEVFLPALVRGFYRLEDRLKMDKEVVRAFMGGELTRRNREEAHHNLILLVRWISNPRQLKAWIGKNLNNNAKAMYGHWYKKFQDEHYRLVKTIRDRGRDPLAPSL